MPSPQLHRAGDPDSPLIQMQRAVLGDTQTPGESFLAPLGSKFSGTTAGSSVTCTSCRHQDFGGSDTPASPFGAEGEGQTSRQAGSKRITLEKLFCRLFFFVKNKKKSLFLSELTTTTCCLGNPIVQDREELRPSFCTGWNSTALL